MKTCLAGLKEYIKNNPRKNYKGYFVYDGRELSDKEVRNVVNYGVKHGYMTEADIPDDEIEFAMEGGEE